MSADVAENGASSPGGTSRVRDLDASNDGDDSKHAPERAVKKPRTSGVGRSNKIYCHQGAFWTRRPVETGVWLTASAACTQTIRRTTLQSRPCLSAQTIGRRPRKSMATSPSLADSRIAPGACKESTTRTQRPFEPTDKKTRGSVPSAVKFVSCTRWPAGRKLSEYQADLWSSQAHVRNVEGRSRLYVTAAQTWSDTSSCLQEICRFGSPVDRTNGTSLAFERCRSSRDGPRRRQRTHNAAETIKPDQSRWRHRARQRLVVVRLVRLGRPASRRQEEEALAQVASRRQSERSVRCRG